MWSRGWCRSGQTGLPHQAWRPLPPEVPLERPTSTDKHHDASGRDDTPRPVHEDRTALEWDRGNVAGGADHWVSGLAHPRERSRAVQTLDHAGRSQPISRRTNAPGDVSESNFVLRRWQDRPHTLLGATHRGRAVPGLRGQLRPPRMSGPLVPPIRPVHVSLPRWRVLPGRLACFGTAASRAVRISLSGGDRQADDRDRTTAHPVNQRPTRNREPWMSRLKQIGEWFNGRPVGGVIRESIEHPMPSKTGSWWYVFGSAAVTIFGLQV